MDWIAEAITQKFFIRSTYCELRGLSLAETKVFRDLMSEVNNLSYGDDAKLEDVIKRTKTAIIETFGKQYDYLKQLDNITFTPSIYELTRHEYYECAKEKMLQEIANKSPQELRDEIEKDCLENNETFPQELKERADSEILELWRHQIEKLYQSMYLDSKKLSWYSGIKNFLNLLNYIVKHTQLLEQKSNLLTFQVRGKNLLVYRGDDRLIEIEVKPTKYDPQRGELDIFINAVSGINFKNGFVHQPKGVLVYNDIHLCSWHGFYKENGSDLMYPLINLKDESRKALNIGEGRHNAVICQKDIIAVPICSIQIPMELMLRGRMNRSELAVSLDLFLLPKNIPWEKYAETFVYRMYCIHEHIACFSPSMHGMLSGGLAENCIVDIKPIEFKLKNGQWDAILRCIYHEDQSSDISIYFYATHNPIDYALNRGISDDIQNTPYTPDEEDKPFEKQFLRDIHENELRDLGLLPAYGNIQTG
jgi:hypothetical protein